jgi:hypothetical protein
LIPAELAGGLPPESDRQAAGITLLRIHLNARRYEEPLATTE